MAYLTVTEVESGLSALANTYPALTSLVTLPNNTHEGRTCHALRIGTGSAGTKDGILFIGGVHAREWGSCEISINFAADMLEAFTRETGLVYGGKSFTANQVRAIVEGLHVFVFPLVNPDGRHHSQTVVPMWRRNRNPADSGGNPDCVGVDVNRNYDWLWDFPNKFSPDAIVRVSTDPCELELSGEPGTGTYHGSSPFSEAETKNVRWLLDTYPSIRWLVDLHSHSELILHPWGDDQVQTTDSSMNFMNPAYDTARGELNDDYREYIPAADLTAVTEVANRMRDAIQAVRGKTYTVQSGFELYATAGTGSDYVYSQHFADTGKFKVPGFTIEWGTEFQPPWDEMERIILDITAALIEFCLAPPPR